MARQTHNFHLGIAASFIWPAGLDDADAWREWLLDANSAMLNRAIDLAHIDPLARRRLGMMTRIALHVANRASTDVGATQIVFSSRHGELTRSLEILQGLACNEMPSPAAFSLSVHNTSIGIHSIARSDSSPGVALAAGEETMLWALLDATTRLRTQPDLPVLLVHADETPPVPYADHVSPKEPTHAIGLLLREGDDLTLSWTENSGETVSPYPLSMVFMECLCGHRNEFEWHGERLTVWGCLHA